MRESRIGLKDVAMTTVYGISPTVETKSASEGKPDTMSRNLVHTN